MSRKRTIEEAKELFKERGLVLLEDVYISNKKKMKCCCPNHPDKEIYLKTNDIISGHGCKYCGIERRVLKRRVPFESVKEAFEEKGYILISTQKDYVNSSSKLRYVCPYHKDKETYLTYGSLREGHGCRYCAGEENSKRQRKDFAEIERLFAEKGYILLSTKEKYKNSQSQLEYICPKHPDIVQDVSYHNFVSGTGCRYCASQNSSGERRIRELLEERRIAFEEQKKFKDLRNPKTGYLLSYDFYLPNYNILIEYQGGYHNGMVNKRNPKRQTEQQLKEQQDRDNLKREYAKNHNIKLLEIWYWDYKKIEEILNKELVK